MEKNSNKGVIIVLIIIIILLGALCALLATGKISIKSGTSTNNQQFSKNNDANDNQNNNTSETIIFDGSKSINSNEKGYVLSCQGNAGIWVEVDSTGKELTFSFTPTKVIEFYSLTWTSTRNDIVSSKINFEKKIVDVYFGGMGQSSANDTLFILLEDGTVEYIPIVHMFNHTQAEVKSYGIINGVSDIVKFMLSSTTYGVTTLAVKSDGTFYDLWYSLKDTGNY